MNFNSRTKTMSLGAFSYMPRLPEAAFAEQAHVQRDRYEVHFSSASLQNVDLDKLLHKQLLADAFVVNNSVIKIYRDLRYPLEKISKVGHYPHQMLMKSKTPINIKKGIFSNCFIEYMEKNPLSDSSGRVRFMESHLTWNNMTNIPAEINRNRYFTFDISTKVLGQLPLQGKFKFDLLGKNGEFNFAGVSGSCDATQLNSISKPMALIQVDKGKINSMKFDLNGNDNQATGDFELQYKDISVKMLKVNDEEKGKGYKKRGIMSFLANTLLKDENPHKGELRSFTVSFKRDPYKSFFNLIWKTVFVGIQETLGMPGGKLRNAVRK